jgi:MFS family permease
MDVGPETRRERPPRAVASGQPAPLAALRVRRFRTFWVGQLAAAAGVSMQSVSLPWLVLSLGGSAFEVGLVVALQYATVPVIAPLSGVVADRIEKRRLLLRLHGAALATAVVLFWLVAGGTVQTAHVLVIATLLGVLNALEMPVRQSFLADLVPAAELRSAVTLTMMGFNAARMVGPAMAGIVIATVGISANFAINALGSLAVVAALVMVGTVGRPSGIEARAGIRAALGEGLSFARRTPSVHWPLALLAGVAVLGMNFQVLLPLLARDVLGLGGEGYGLLFAALGLGSLLGSVAVTALRPASWRPVMLGGAAAFVASELLLGAVGTIALAGPLVVAMGLSAMLMVTAVNVSIQERVTDALRGRIMSLYVTVFAGAVPIGGLLTGAVAQASSAGTALVLGATGSAVVLLVVARGMRTGAERPRTAEAT